MPPLRHEVCPSRGEGKMAEQKMPHPGHDKHLCYLVNLGFQVSNPEEYKPLVKDGKFYCEGCGRVAASEANVCRPAKL